MKRNTIFALLAAFALSVATVPAADAGWFKKDQKKRTEKPDWMKRPQSFGGPVMDFHAGVLQQDGLSGWKLGELNLRFSKDCYIASDGGEAGSLDSGRKAIVMGPRVGDTILAWSIRVKQPDFALGGAVDPEIHRVVSEVNPNCGELIKAPQ